MRRPDPARAAGLVLGVLLDDLLGDPRRGHPVAAFGSSVLALERRCYADDRRAGAVFTAAAVLPVVLAGAAGERRLRDRPVLRTLAVAAATWTVVAGRGLRAAAQAVGTELDAGRIDGARAALPSLCGRSPDQLVAADLARATVESVAENTSDAVVGPLVWGAVAGVPGLLGYRAVNTLDAMVGHRSPRYARFGTASARLDDVANLVPARLTGVLTVLGARAVGGDAGGGLRAWRRDAAGHPSPNAGVCEATAAGVLGLRLGGRTPYPTHVELRPVLGDGRAPDVGDIDRAVRLSRVVQLGALAVCAAAAAPWSAPLRRGVRE